MLKHLLSTPQPRRGQAIAANLLPVDQAALLPPGWSPESAAVDVTGWAYVPARCANVTCGVHVHYHCCGCNWRELSTSYMLGNGLPGYAEGIGLVVVYPQASTQGPFGQDCWDWSGSTGEDTFDTRASVQLGLALSMMGHVTDSLRRGRRPVGFPSTLHV